MEQELHSADASPAAARQRFFLQKKLGRLPEVRMRIQQMLQLLRKLGAGQGSDQAERPHFSQDLENVIVTPYYVSLS